MLHLKKVKIYLLATLILTSYTALPQTSLTDTSIEITSLHNAVNFYHSFLSPETGLYNGSEYTYYAYYPFVINEGHPFFQSNSFDTGSVFYNNVLYENVLLQFDIVKEELVTKDPSKMYSLKLHSDRIGWFNISGHTFVRPEGKKTSNPVLSPGFYDLLYNGNTPLYKKATKILNEYSSSTEGLYHYVVESDEYFIKKNNQYYKIKGKKSLMPLLNDSKKEVAQFIRKNKLNLKKNKDISYKMILTYYDRLPNHNVKAAN
ncbi:MAG: hypothetical protein ABI416_18520 [Ginsengibacter sp.]